MKQSGLAASDNFSGSVRMLFLRPSRPHSQEDLERNGTIAVSRVERSRLRIEGDIAAESKLPCAVVNQIAHASKRKRSDAIHGMHRRLGKKFVLVDQLQP